MKSPKTVSYTLMIGDLFHIGHLKMLETARKSADYHICGVITDDIIIKWIPPLICSFKERKEVIDKVKYVDETMSQSSLDPTENLEKIHKRFPNSKIMLIQNHILGGSSILGMDYIKQINGEIIPHKFYSNLSREYIRNIFLKDFAQNRNLSNISVSDIKIGDIEYFKQHFSTKANTIKSLRQILKNAIIEKEFIFSVEQWENDGKAILDKISQIFVDEKIVIRSSSLNEDSVDYSNAGHFESVLNVNSSNQDETLFAIEKVISSYSRGDNYLKENQVLVQKQTDDVITSGVIFTRNLWSNTPYYLINYDDKSSKTDTVTGGLASCKIEIINDLPIAKVISRWRNLIAAVREIELFFRGLTLDIEFAVTRNGGIVIFQVRPLAANSRFYSIDDNLIKQRVVHLQEQYVSSCNSVKNTSNLLNSSDLYFSDMAFWNPAELIGDRPNYLDFSLFNHLLMKVNWNEALIPLGFTRVDKPLMVLIGNKPYIDIYNSFLCLLPQKLPVEIKKKLIGFYFNKLHEHPELHDKIEFEIVHNCYRFDFEIMKLELLENNFRIEELNTIRESLIDLTNKILLEYNEIIYNDSLSISLLEQRYNELHSIYLSEKNDNQDGIVNNDVLVRKKLSFIYQLIEDCYNLGAQQFSRVARMAFIGNALIKSLRDTNIISANEFDNFMCSISTVATEMDNDFNLLRDKTLSVDGFISKYGHLRPGTYDITKLPYNKNLSYIYTDTSGNNSNKKWTETEPVDFKEVASLIGPRISDVCNKHGIDCDGLRVLDFIKRAIELREYYKFVYTKNISLAIEIIADVGEQFGFNRDQLSNLDYYTIVNYRDSCSKEEILNIWRNVMNGRIEEKRIDMQVSLPPIIFSENDFFQVPTYLVKPNFITDSVVNGEILFLDQIQDVINIYDKIVVIEKADPGYDWIFTKKIRGLITKYGGAASHMAIRCAEFGIPAAIGCGDLLFSKILDSSKLILDCKNRTIHCF